VRRHATGHGRTVAAHGPARLRSLSPSCGAATVSEHTFESIWDTWSGEQGAD
jgi:hypothetical protein